MSARVVHVNDNIPGAVYIGRTNNRYRLAGSPFANPFRIGKYMSRAEAIEQYRLWLERRMAFLLYPKLPALRDKPLACWCRRDGEPRTEKNACHGDILAGLLERYTDDDLRAMAQETG